MFTQGQIIFAIIAVVLFAVLMFFSYKSDRKRSKKYFKGSYVVVIFFVLLMAFLTYLKFHFEVK